MKVGSLVECVKNFLSAGSFLKNGEKLPVVGALYTVRDMEYSKDLNRNFIKLDELINPIVEYSDGFHECQFCSTHFREVQEPMEINFEELIKKGELV